MIKKEQTSIKIVSIVGRTRYLMTLVNVLTVVSVRRQCVAVSTLAAERADDVAAASVATEVRHDVALIHICPQSHVLVLFPHRVSL